MGLWHIRACLKNHSCNLHALLCGIFHPNSVVVARYDALIRVKSPTNCDAHLAESLFQTCSKNQVLIIFNYISKDTPASIAKSGKSGSPLPEQPKQLLFTLAGLKERPMWTVTRKEQEA